MKRKKEDYFVIALGVILVIIIFIIAFIVTNDSKDDIEAVIENTPTPAPSQRPRPTAEANSRPPVFYVTADQDKILDYVRNRRPISDSDRLSKAKILAKLPDNTPSGVVYKSNNILIDYTKSADVFQVEILTTEVQAAKNEANVWLRTQGLSQKAICEFPIAFYLNYDVANTLRETGYVFSPLSNGC